MEMIDRVLEYSLLIGNCTWTASEVTDIATFNVLVCVRSSEYHPGGYVRRGAYLFQIHLRILKGVDIGQHGFQLLQLHRRNVLECAAVISGS